MKIYLHFLSFWLVSWLCVGAVVAQEQVIYNFASASHPIEITQITENQGKTTIRFRLTNQIAQGYFCLSKSISAINQAEKYTGKHLKTSGISICPENYHFKQIGESVEIELQFEAFPKHLMYIDIDELCGDNCLSVKGIVVNSSFNERINLAYRFFGESKFAMAADLYESLLSNTRTYPFALHYFNAIHANAQVNRFVQAKALYKALKSSQFTDSQSTLARLRSMPYFTQLL